MSKAVAPTGPADIRTARRLAELEVVIERGKTAFIEVGEALIEVRESRLYRLTYGTFDEYLAKRWPDITRRRAYQFMEAAEVAALPDVQKVAQPNEAQARELAPLLRSDGEEAVREAWSEAVARSDGKPTAKVVRQVVAEIIEPLPADEESVDLTTTPADVDQSNDWYVASLRKYVEGIVGVLPPPQVNQSLYRARHSLSRELLAALDAFVSRASSRSR